MKTEQTITPFERRLRALENYVAEMQTAWDNQEAETQNIDLTRRQVTGGGFNVLRRKIDGSYEVQSRWDAPFGGNVGNKSGEMVLKINAGNLYVYRDGTHIEPQEYLYSAIPADMSYVILKCTVSRNPITGAIVPAGTYQALTATWPTQEDSAIYIVIGLITKKTNWIQWNQYTMGDQFIYWYSQCGVPDPLSSENYKASLVIKYFVENCNVFDY